MARILVVDDDDQVRGFIRLTLEEAGHEVLEAANGKKGTRVCQRELVDVVITDIMMPEKEGLETTWELRRQYPNLGIIVITGGCDKYSFDPLHMAKLFGADRVFSKPLDTARLLRAVEELVGKVPHHA